MSSRLSGQGPSEGRQPRGHVRGSAAQQEREGQFLCFSAGKVQVNDGRPAEGGEKKPKRAD